MNQELRVESNSALATRDIMLSGFEYKDTKKIGLLQINRQESKIFNKIFAYMNNFSYLCGENAKRNLITPLKYANAHFSHLAI